jgi:hypothetical protein
MVAIFGKFPFPSGMVGSFSQAKHKIKTNMETYILITKN